MQRDLRLGPVLVGVVLVGLLAGCSMVPLRSMLKLSAMGEDMLGNDPQYLRVAVRYDARIGLDPQDTKIQYVVTEKDGDVVTKGFGLDPIQKGPRVDPTLPRATDGLEWTLLGLTPDGVEALRVLQNRLQTRRGELESLELSVTAGFGRIEDPTLTELPFDVWVLLEPQGKYIQILRGPVKIERTD